MFLPRRLVLRPWSNARWHYQGFRGSVVALVLCLAVGCSRSLPGHKRVAAVAPGATLNEGTPAIQLLGTVHVIGTGDRFVLVQASTAALVASLVDGQTLVCRAAGNVTGTLRVSHERRPPFVVADVVTGTPHLGDDVLIEPATARSTPTPTLPPSAPASPPPPAPSFRVDPALPSTQ